MEIVLSKDIEETRKKERNLYCQSRSQEKKSITNSFPPFPHRTQFLRQRPLDPQTRRLHQENLGRPSIPHPRPGYLFRPSNRGPRSRRQSRQRQSRLGSQRDTPRTHFRRQRNLWRGNSGMLLPPAHPFLPFSLVVAQLTDQKINHRVYTKCTKIWSTPTPPTSYL